MKAIKQVFLGRIKVIVVVTATDEKILVFKQMKDSNLDTCTCVLRSMFPFCSFVWPVGQTYLLCTINENSLSYKEKWCLHNSWSLS